MQTESASGRYLCSGDAMHLREVVALLKSSGFDTYSLPKVDLSGKVGTLLMKLLSFTQPKDTGTYIRTNIGQTMRYDNSKIKRELGISFIPAKKSIIDAVKDMVKWGHLPPKNNNK